MTTFIDVPLWDEPVAERPDDPNIIRTADGKFQCRDCHEIVDSEMIFTINHGMCFNGWCIAHLHANNGANPTQHEWLEAHGFVQVDRFDEAFWNLP